MTACVCYQPVDATWMYGMDAPEWVYGASGWSHGAIQSRSESPASEWSQFSECSHGSEWTQQTSDWSQVSEWSQAASQSRPQSPEQPEQDSPRQLCLWDSLSMAGTATHRGPTEALDLVLESRVAELSTEFQLSSGDGDAFDRASNLLDKVPPGKLVQGMVVSLALDSRGCRLLQDALETCDSFARRELMMEFKGHVRKALESPHANHVLQRAVELMPPTATRFLLDELMRTWDLASVVQHKFGCRLLERVFEHFTASAEASQDLTFYLSSGLCGDVAAHCFHIFGTHVMQHVLEYGTAEQQCVVWQALRGDLRRAATDEYAVGVLDKALTFLPRSEQQSLVKCLLEQQVFHNMALSWRGQSAAERLLRIAEGPLLTAALAQLEAHHSALRRSKSGRSILALAARRSQ